MGTSSIRLRSMILQDIIQPPDPFKALSIIYLFTACIFTIGRIYSLIKIAWLRKKGIYPLKGMESLEYVKKLLTQGEFALAIKCYRKIYGNNISLKGAKESVLAIKSELENNNL